MKHLRTDAEAFLHFLIDPGIAVLWIPGDRVPDGCQVGADLVGTTGDQVDLQKGISVSRRQIRSDSCVSVSVWQISIALRIPGQRYWRLPAPSPVAKISKLSGNFSEVLIAATTAAPVGVTISPSISVILSLR